MSFTEQAISIDCGGDELLGIITESGETTDIGVVIVVGGPQYRIGSHRQFVLLARALGHSGYSCLRFDHRGIGDSEGDTRSFEQLDADIGSAINALFAHVPSVNRVVLWGLCDAASAILLYWQANRDPRIASMVLLNPWVRAEQTLAQTRVRHYYGQRLLQGDFWRKLLSGGLELRNSAKEFLDQVKSAFIVKRATQEHSDPFQNKVRQALEAFPGELLVVLSGEDYTAKEFSIWLGQQFPKQSGKAAQQFDVEHVPGADHTFSSMQHQRELEAMTVNWLARFQMALK